MKKGDFIGKAQLEKQLAAGVPNRFITLEVHGVTDADPLGNEPLFDASGNIVGRATSGYYGHYVRKSLAIGYVKAEFANRGHAALHRDPRRAQAGHGHSGVPLRS